MYNSNKMLNISRKKEKQKNKKLRQLLPQPRKLLNLPHFLFNYSSLTLFILIVFTSINVIVFASQNAPNHIRSSKRAVQKRYMQCLRTNSFLRNERTECASVSIGENDKPSNHYEQKLTDFGRGCYQQFEPKLRSLRYLCPLHCKNATESTVISKSPSSNHKCTQFYNYGIFSHHADFYLWRSEMCLNETMEFQVRCMFGEKRNLRRKGLPIIKITPLPLH